MRRIATVVLSSLFLAQDALTKKTFLRSLQANINVANATVLNGTNQNASGNAALTPTSQATTGPAQAPIGILSSNTGGNNSYNSSLGNNAGIFTADRLAGVPYVTVSPVYNQIPVNGRNETLQTPNFTVISLRNINATNPNASLNNQSRLGNNGGAGDIDVNRINGNDITNTTLTPNNATVVSNNIAQTGVAPRGDNVTVTNPSALPIPTNNISVDNATVVNGTSNNKSANNNSSSISPAANSNIDVNNATVLNGTNTAESAPAINGIDSANVAPASNNTGAQNNLTLVNNTIVPSS